MFDYFPTGQIQKYKKWVSPSYYLTQILTSHGNFKKYLATMPFSVFHACATCYNLTLRLVRGVSRVLATPVQVQWALEFVLPCAVFVCDGKSLPKHCAGVEVPPSAACTLVSPTQPQHTGVRLSVAASTKSLSSEIAHSAGVEIYPSAVRILMPLASPRYPAASSIGAMPLSLSTP